MRALYWGNVELPKIITGLISFVVFLVDFLLVYFLFLAAAFWALAGKLPLEVLPPLFFAEALCILEAALDDIFLPIWINNGLRHFNLNLYLKENR